MSKALVKKPTDLGVTAESLTGTVPTFNAPLVASAINRFGAQAVRVLEGAQRAVIDNATSAAVATDFLKAINTQITTVEDARKLHAQPFDKAFKALNVLFNKGPAAKLALAKTVLETKLGLYLRKEREEAEAVAEQERQRIAAEAAASATQAVAEGDSAGALEIIESAAAVVVQAERPVVRGHSSVLATVKRKVGKVKDMRKFLDYLVQNYGPQALNVLGAVTIGQRELNQLAAHAFATNENRDAQYDTSIPGFEASYEETFGAR